MNASYKKSYVKQFLATAHKIIKVWRREGCVQRYPNQRDVNYERTINFFKSYVRKFCGLCNFGKSLDKEGILAG